MKIKKVLYKKGKKEFIKELDRKITVQRFEKYFLKNINTDYNTKYGVIKKTDLAKKDGTVIKSKNQEFVLFSRTIFSY